MNTIIKHGSCWMLLLLIFVSTAKSQTVPQGITYQGLARNFSGAVISNQGISVKLGIYSPTVSGTLEWEELHNVTTNSMGLFYFIIGQGTSSGMGTAASFSAINWGAADHFMKISMDPSGGSSYVSIDTVQFWSVAYSMFAGTAGSANQAVRLHQLTDADTTGVMPGYVLKWNGSLWLPAPDNDSDTASFAANAGHSANSDTAMYALNVLSLVDTVAYSYNSDSSLFATGSGTSINSGHSDYCDTALYAYNTASTFNYWNVTGNTGISSSTNFLGTINSADLVFKTNNLERMRITSAGKIGVGTSVPTATLHIIGNDGVVAEGTFGTGAVPPTGAGTRMIWYPKKGAFRAGTVTASQWDDASIGNYSFAANNNNVASGAYSTAFGFGSVASGQYSFAACQGSSANGIASIAMGTGCSSTGHYSVSIGRASTASDSSAVAIGYHNTATGKYSVSLGYESLASGDYSTVMGFWGSSNGKKGSFVYADYSSSSVTSSSADNQFLVRAAGGTLFYSNAALTTGVSLPAGGGSWASVSDKNKKEHFRSENADAILRKIALMNITSWNYKTQAPSIRHIGPMAQDFYKAFGFGESDTTITTVDMDGISLIAIQALAQKTAELKTKAEEVERLKSKVAKLEQEKKILEKRISGIEQQLNLSPTLTSLNFH
jgi:trimeric autotransporter adhesin